MRLLRLLRSILVAAKMMHHPEKQLEVCVAILKFVAQKGPQTPRKIEVSKIAKADIIKECLELLIEQKLLEKRTNPLNIETYVNTERGKRVSEFFHF